MVDEAKKEVKGAFIASLIRSNSKIKADRAEAIGEDAELIYKREVEDLRVKISRMKRNRENMLDMSPDNTMSLKPAVDFDATEFVKNDMALGVQIRETGILLEIAEERYAYLFGEVI